MSELWSEEPSYITKTFQGKSSDAVENQLNIFIEANHLQIEKIKESKIRCGFLWLREEFLMTVMYKNPSHDECCNKPKTPEIISGKVVAILLSIAKDLEPIH